MQSEVVKQRLTKSQTVMVAIIIVGGFICMLNQLVMSPALPAVMRDFEIDAATGQWLTSIFLLVNGLMVPITAYLINRFSTRQIYIASMLSFSAGSTLAALAPDFIALLSGRIIQAIGAGIMMPLSTVLLMLIFPKSKRGFALGMSGVVVGFAPAFGPTLAGWIVDELGWRYIFAIIAPLAVILMILAIFKLENLGEKSMAKLDWVSVILSTVGFGGLLYGFSNAGSAGWTSPLTFGAIVVGAAVLVFFVRRQYSQIEPMLDLRVLKNRIFSTSTILSAVVASSLTVGAVLTPIFLQNVLDMSALQSGLVQMPGALCMVGMSPVSGILFDRFGPRILSITGLSLMTIGSLMLSFLHVDTTYTYACIGYTFRMLGISMVYMPINTWGLNVLPNRLIAHGNAINNTARQIGGSLGTAILVTVMMTVASYAGATVEMANVDGINVAFRCATGLTVSALILAVLCVKGNRDDENH